MRHGKVEESRLVKDPSVKNSSQARLVKLDWDKYGIKFVTRQFLATCLRFRN